ncbi:MAG: hypothetical protein GY913_26540 [Proteobacteria bacterium]|nr:hypothetical protein [Pseudomonadota bacterium]MCP4920476.1 hypothetical protein [Pseudomonadota bacterium]
MSGGGHKKITLGDGLTKALIVGLLFVLMLFLQAVHTPHEGLLNPVAMATFGFIILAAYTLGELAETIKLPHITAYLVTGILLGHHAHEVLHTPHWMTMLDHETVEELSLFNDLAVALIALSAGGALELGTLRRGARLFSSVLTLQYVALLSILGGLVWLISGPIDGFALPFLVDQPQDVRIGAAVLLAVVGAAMSPAASIAIVHETRSRGPVTDTVLGVSVLNNVVVVVLFAAAISVLGPRFGAPPSEQGLALELLIKIGGAVVLGGAMGGGIALVTRWIGNELLLILTGLCFGITYLAAQVGVDALLAFLFAGFVVRNFTRPAAHDQLKSAVDRLSMPIYVVFFFLAGAHLDLQGLVASAAFAGVLFAGRMLALWLGTAAGTRVGQGPEILAKWGFLGFGAQAGIALAMATVIAGFGGVGADLATMAVAGIALNEMVGPVLLKVALGIAKEVPQDDDPTLDEAFTLAEDDPEPDTRLPEWLPEPGHTQFDPWGEPPDVTWRKLLKTSRNLKGDLQTLTREVRSSTTSARRQTAQQFLGQLRREFLRYHRRLQVKACDPNTTREDMARAVRDSRAQLARTWEDHILDRAASVDFRREADVLQEMLRAIDRLVDALPSATEVPLEDRLVAARPGDGPWLGLNKGLVRAARAIGLGEPMRIVELRPLARFTLSGHAPLHLGELAGLMALSERHLLARTRNVFEVLRKSEDELLAHDDFEPGSWDPLLASLRGELEEEFQLAQREVDRLADETVRVAAAALGRPYKQFNRALAIAGTPELRSRHYRFSKVYQAREEAIRELLEGLGHAHLLTRGVAAGMAMELQLVRLADSARDAVDAHSDTLARDLSGKVVLQLGRIVEALDAAITQLDEDIASDVGPDELEARIRTACTAILHVVDDALSVAETVRAGLRTETAIEPLRNALAGSVDGLTDRFDVAVNPPGLSGRRLPAAPRIEDVAFRELAATYLDAEVGRDLSLLVEELLEQVEVIARGMEELERSLKFNLDLTHTELTVLAQADVVPVAAREILRETLLATLQRLAGRLGQLHAANSELGADAAGRIQDAVFRHIEALHGLLVGGQWDEVRRRLNRGKLARRRRLITGGAESLTDLRDHLGEAVQRAMGPEGYATIRRSLGLPETATAEVGPETFAEVRPAIELPAVFRRLFSDAALEVTDLLEGRELELEALRRVLVGEGAGRSRSVAILGSGEDTRGAAVNALVRGLPAKVARHVLTEPVRDLAEIERIEAKATGGVVVVVEGAHWLFSIEPGGFEALRCFAREVIDDDGNNAFVLSIDPSVWAYADRVVSMRDVFPHRLELGPLDPDSLRRALLGRHRMSGYGLRFAETDAHLGQWLRRATSRGGADERIEEHYFEDLFEATGGLLSDALRLWMASVIEVDTQNDVLVLGDVPAAPLASVRALDDESLLTLRQLARQGRIDVSLHARQFRRDPDHSGADLSRLAHLGLVRRTRRGRYALAGHLAAALRVVLRERGLDG